MNHSSVKIGRIPLPVLMTILGVLFSQFQAKGTTRRVEEINIARGSTADSEILSKVLFLTARPNDGLVKLPGDTKIHISTVGEPEQLKSFNATFKSPSGAKIELKLGHTTKTAAKLSTHFKNGQVLYLAHQKSVFVCENCFHEDSDQDKLFKQIVVFKSDISSMKIVRNKISIVLEDGRVLGLDLSNRKVRSDVPYEFKEVNLNRKDVKMAFEYFGDTLYTVNAKNVIMAWSRASENLEKFQSPVGVAKWSEKIEDVTILPNSGKMYISTENSISVLNLVKSKEVHNKKCTRSDSRQYRVTPIGNQVQYHWIEGHQQIFTSNTQCEAVKKEEKLDIAEGEIIAMVGFPLFSVSDEFIIRNEPMMSTILGGSLKVLIFVFFVCCAVPLFLMVVMPMCKFTGPQKKHGQPEKLQMVRSSMNNGSGYYQYIKSATAGLIQKYDTKSNNDAKVIEL